MLGEARRIIADTGNDEFILDSHGRPRKYSPGTSVTPPR
jgi:hypothetical protein